MKIGLTVVVLALMGTILAGSVAFTQSPTVETSYDRVADLAPIVSYSAVTGDELYNPISNQVGWEGVSYVTQDTPSIYSYTTPGELENQTSNTILSYGGYYYPDYSSPLTRASDLKWNDDSSPWNAKPIMIGGYHSRAPDNLGLPSYVIDLSVKYVLDGVTTNVAVNSSYWWQDLKRIASNSSWPTGTVVDGGSDVSIYNGVSYYASSGFETPPIPNPYQTNKWYYYYQTLNMTSTAASYYWDADAQNWYEIIGYAPSGKPVLGQAAVNLVWHASSSSATLSYKQYSGMTTYYVTPYSPVTINAGETATWNNGYQNTRVQFIVESGATVTATDGVTTETIILPASASVYEKVLITIGAEAGDRYWQGITTYVSPTEYALLDYHYAITGGSDLDSIYGITVTDSTMAYMVNTWVPADPNGLLWGNPSMDLAAYFPDVMSGDARVIFSSILVTGTSLTINGNTYNTADKMITIDGSDYRLNGLAVDYIDNHVYIVPTTGDAIDLGTKANTVISGTGTWYWSSELDSINETVGTKTDVLFAQSSSAGWMVFAYIGLVILGMVGLAAIGRDGLDGYDWIIMFGSIIIALMLVIS